MPNTSLCAVRDPVAGKWPNACARMGVGLELFKAVHVCLSRLRHHIHYPPTPPASLPPPPPYFFLFSTELVECTAVVQQSRHAGLCSRPQSTYITLSLVEKEHHLGLGATVLTVLGGRACVYVPLWVWVAERGRISLCLICFLSH